MPGLDVAFLVIVTTSVRLSFCGDCSVLICASDLLCIFKPEFSVTHALAFAHFVPQSGPAWQKICGFDNPASPEPPPPAQLEAPKKTNAISPKKQIVRTAVPYREGA
jgi:hypothetical protein